LKHVINTKSQINILFKEKIEKKKNDERRKEYKAKGKAYCF